MEELQCTPRSSERYINADNVIKRYHLKLQCGFCGLNFGKFERLDLESHLKSHFIFTINKSKALQCQICERTLSNAQNLFDHCKDRLNEENEANLSFECSFCEKRFVASCLLRRHLYLKHDVIYSEPSANGRSGTKESKGNTGKQSNKEKTQYS